MDTFTASNGWYIQNGHIHPPESAGDSRVFAVNLPMDAALIEYGRHLERTERHGEAG